MEGAICVSGETRYVSDGSWSVADSHNLKFSKARCTGHYRAECTGIWKVLLNGTE